MSQNRVQAGVPEGGQFAGKQLADADPAVVLAEQPKRELPAEIAAGIPSDEKLTELSDAAHERFRAASSDVNKVDELRLAHAAADLYTQHGITGVGISVHEDVEGSFVSVDSVDLDTGETFDEGVAFEAAEDAVMNIGIDTEEYRDGETTCIDLIGLMKRAPQLAREVEQAQPKPLSAADLVTMAELVSATQEESRVRWTDDEGETVRSGTLRTGTWNADGQPQRYDDVRDAHVRITTDTGAEIFRPLADLARLRTNAQLYLNV